MNKIFAIYLCALLIVISMVLPFAFPTFLIVLYITEGFSVAFIAILMITIFIEPLAIGGTYAILTSIKDIYDDLCMY